MSNLEKDLRGVDAAEAQFLLAELRDQIAEVYWQLNDQDYSTTKAWMDHLCWDITQKMGDEMNGWEEEDYIKSEHEIIKKIMIGGKEITYDEYHHIGDDPTLPF